MKQSIKQAILLMFLCVTVMAFGQSKKVWLYTADDFYEKGDYASAMKYYKKILDDTSVMAIKILPYESQLSNQPFGKDSTKDSIKVDINDYVHHQIAFCYRNTFDYDNAAEHFKATADKGAFPNDQYYYANSLMNLKKYDEALEEYSKFIRSDNVPEEYLNKSQLDMSGCYYAQNPDYIRKKVVVTLADTGIFNKGSSSFGVMYWGYEDKVLFTSAREKGVVLDPTKQDSKFLCDLYWTEKIDQNTWGKPHNFGRPLNSGRHDASGCFNNNNTIVYTRWSNDNPNLKQIYLARMIELKFFEAFKMDSAVNMDGYSSINPYITEDGQWLYYSSDRPGGYGGMDIWRVKVDFNGNPIGKPENLGRPVNSEADEVTPFLHFATGTLFFSSDGHKSIGGLDIFKSGYDNDAESFGAPVNMGQPINSSMDDAYMIWDPKLETGWFSSDREPCEGGHCYDIYQVINEPIQISIEGMVFDNETTEPIPNATIVFKDVEYNFKPFVITTDEDGFYSQDLDWGLEIFMKAQKTDYFADAATQNTKSITQSTVLLQDFFLNKIPEDAIEIPGIEYDFDKATLRPKSKEILDELAEFLELNDNITIEIQSHTDYRGPEAYNKRLSEDRAQSVVDYLITKGIDRSRMIANGYGEGEPAIAMDENKKPLTDANGEYVILDKEYIDALPTEEEREEAHQRNRRTAFKVLSQDHNQ